MPGKNLRLLSLDGGGIRGLSALYILERIMDTINYKRERKGKRRLKPCEYFQMMGGTSTGGLIAIMLGRLEMEVGQCIDAYTNLADEVFTTTTYRCTTNCFTMASVCGKVHAKFDEKSLEGAIKRIICQNGLPENAPLRNDRGRCKVFVCATRSDSKTPILLRSYQQGPIPITRFQPTIWEAARATSAAPTFFEPIKIGTGNVREGFIDGGIRYNNPIQQVWSEAQTDLQSVSPGAVLEVDLECLLSIGTGLPATDSFGRNLLGIAKSLKGIATDTQAAANQFQQDHQRLFGNNQCFRFNVSPGLQGIGLEETTKKGLILARTNEYLDSPAVRDMITSVGEPRRAVQPVQPRYILPFRLHEYCFTGKFVPRIREMELLEETLLPRDSQRRRANVERGPKRLSQPLRQVYVLHGPHGIGKTQLATEFTRKHQKAFSAILWLNGCSKSKLQQEFRELADRIPQEIPETSRNLSSTLEVNIEVVIRKVKNWFEEQDNTKWLLIFDNVDLDHSLESGDKDPESFDVKRFIPSSDHGSILITTRLSKLRQQFENGHEVSMLNEQQGMEILNSCFDEARERPKDLKLIFDTLGGIPLALKQAGSYLRETGCRVTEYLEDYHKHFGELRGDDKPSRSAWTISFQSIEKVRPNAAKFLLLWAHLDNKGIWYEQLAHSLKNSDRPERDTKYGVRPAFPKWFLDCISDRVSFRNEVVSVLRDYSLIDVREEHGWHPRPNSVHPVRSYCMHPLLHKWCYHSESKKKPEYACWAASMLSADVLSRAGGDFRILVSKDMLIVHCNRLFYEIEKGLGDTVQDNRLRRDLYLSCTRFGGAYAAAGEHRKSERMYRRAYDGLRGVLGPEDARTLHAGCDLAKIYKIMKNTDQAERTLREVLQLKRSPALDLYQASQLHASLNCLADLYMMQRKWREAHLVLIEAWEGIRPESEPMFQNNDTYQYLGRLCYLAGRPHKAVEMFLYALANKMRTLGDANPSTDYTKRSLDALFEASRGSVSAAEFCSSVLARIEEQPAGPPARRPKNLRDDPAARMLSWRARDGSRPTINLNRIVRPRTISDLIPSEVWSSQFPESRAGLIPNDCLYERDYTMHLELRC